MTTTVKLKKYTQIKSETGDERLYICRWLDGLYERLTDHTLKYKFITCFGVPTSYNCTIKSKPLADNHFGAKIQDELVSHASLYIASIECVAVSHFCMVIKKSHSYHWAS